MCFCSTETEGRAQKNLCVFPSFPVIIVLGVKMSNYNGSWLFNFFYLFLMYIYIHHYLICIFISRPGKKASSGISQGERWLCVMFFCTLSRRLNVLIMQIETGQIKSLNQTVIRKKCTAGGVAGSQVCVESADSNVQ